ncbi:MAG TPA: cytochrome P450 [Solirubrobacterales bacterium]|nr:cytochrome P450 [Solirubrobacterales bacterium]
MPYPPGPNLPPLIQTLRWVARPLEFMEQGRRAHGEVFSVRFAGFRSPMVMVSDPELVKTVYANPANSLPEGRIALLEPVLGPRSVILLDGKEHLARRRLMLPAFHGERMRSYEDVMREAIDREIESWPVGEQFPIHPRMQAVTLEVILRTVFGVTDGARLDRLRELLGKTLENTAAPGWQVLNLFTRRLGVPSGPSGFSDVLAQVDRELAGLIAERRRDPGLEQREDILSMMAAAEFADGERMEESELRDQLMTLLLAGHETTATALAWTFDLLLHDPRVLARLRAELAEGGDEYLRATITESLRLRPVIPIAGRILDEPVEVDGFQLEAGANVAPSIWMAHTRADSFPEPFAFRPERFLDDPPETYSWIPFGGGVRRCLGAAFAEFEMRVVLTEVLTRCDLRAAGTKPQKVGRRNITLSPKAGTPVVMTGRSPVPVP